MDEDHFWDMDYTMNDDMPKKKGKKRSKEMQDWEETGERFFKQFA